MSSLEFMFENQNTYGVSSSLKAGKLKIQEETRFVQIWRLEKTSV